VPIEIELYEEESLHKKHAPLEIDDLTLRMSRANHGLLSRSNEPPCEMSTTSSNKSRPPLANGQVVPEKFHRKLSSLRLIVVYMVYVVVAVVDARTSNSQVDSCKRNWGGM